MPPSSQTCTAARKPAAGAENGWVRLLGTAATAEPAAHHPSPESHGTLLLRASASGVDVWVGPGAARSSGCTPPLGIATPRRTPTTATEDDVAARRPGRKPGFPQEPAPSGTPTNGVRTLTLAQWQARAEWVVSLRVAVHERKPVLG